MSPGVSIALAVANITGDAFTASPLSCTMSDTVNYNFEMAGLLKGQSTAAFCIFVGSGGTLLGKFPSQAVCLHAAVEVVFFSRDRRRAVG